MIKRSIPYFSALAIAAAAMTSSSAFAHGTNNDDYRHRAFHQKEEDNRRIFANQREYRVNQMREKIAAEKRELIHRSGRRGSEWYQYERRWARMWNELYERERETLIQERISEHRRHERFHVVSRDGRHAGYDDECSTDPRDLDRELARYGLGRDYAYDNWKDHDSKWKRRRYGRDRYGDSRNVSDNVDVDADFGFRVRVGN